MRLVDPLSFPYTRGFILINFPSTEEEVRYLDGMFTGFVEMERRLSKRAESKREKISKIMQISERKKEQDAFPTFDLVLTQNITSEEILNRIAASLLDPETQVVYHPQINPIPESDKKLKERLIKCPVDEEMIAESAENF